MTIQDFALITFTILIQMSVGAFVVLAIVHLYLARKANREEADRLAGRAMWIIGPMIALGLAASLLHLGDPLGGYRAINNFGTSWLSREIVFSLSFAMLAAVYALLQWFKLFSFVLRSIVAWITAVFGIAIVISMSNVYFLLSQPAWNSWATLITFFTTTFLLGSLVMGVFLVADGYGKRKETSEFLGPVMRAIAVTSVVLLGIELVTLPVYLATLASGQPAAVETAQLLVGPYAWAFIARLVLVVLGAGVFGLFLYRNALGPKLGKALVSVTYAAFAMVFASEVLGRLLFYATHVKIGI